MWDEYWGGGRNFCTQIHDARYQDKATACKKHYCVLLSVSSPQVQRHITRPREWAALFPVIISIVLFFIKEQKILTKKKSLTKIINTWELWIFLTVYWLEPLTHSHGKLGSITLQVLWLMSIRLKICLEPDVVLHAGYCSRIRGSLRQEDSPVWDQPGLFSEFQGSLGYLVSSRVAWATK